MALSCQIAPNEIEAARPGVQAEMIALVLEQQGKSGAPGSALEERLKEFTGG